MQIIKTILILSLIVGPNIVYAEDWTEQARQYYEKGKEFYDKGRYKEAEEEFQKAFPLIFQNDEEVSGQEKIPAPAEPRKPAKGLEYVIDEGDVLHISVWEEKDLEQDVVVRPDGKISFPLVGDLQALGLSITQLDEDLTSKLKEYIISPEVSIHIQKIGGKKIIVLGEVTEPGVYSVTGRKTVLEAIALANGFTEDAVLSSVILIRGGFQEPQGMRLNLTRAIERADISQNIALEPEDTIYVPKKFIANVNYFVSKITGPLSEGIYTADRIRNY